MLIFLITRQRSGLRSRNPRRRSTARSAVPAGADTADISALADECCREILALGADAVLVQGEMSLSFAVAGRLQIRGVTVLCACSERVCDTAVLSDGSTERRSVFRFVRFREYPPLL